MKLLLDEHLPHLFRHEIPGHDVRTVAFMGWSGIENGELLPRAAADGFDALITNDHGIQHERNVTEIPVAVVLMNAEKNTIECVRHMIPALLAALERLQPCGFVKLT